MRFSVLSAVLLAPLVLASPTPPGSAQFEYDHGFTATGTFQATCAASGMTFTTNPIVLTHHGGIVTTYRTWANETYLTPDGPMPVSTENDTQDVTTTTLEAGTLTMDGQSGSHVFLRRPVEGETGALKASLNATRIDASPADDHFETGAGPYYEHWASGVHGYTPMIPGPARQLHTDTATHLHGNGTIKADGVTLTNGPWSLTLPPAKVVTQETTPPGLLLRTTRYVHAVIQLQELDTVTSGSPACGNMDWTGTGSVTYRNAHGDARRQGSIVQFQRRELTLRGSQTTHEELSPTPEGTRPGVRAQAAGAFDAVELDFVPAMVPAAPPLPIVEVGIAALLLGAAAWVAGLGHHLARVPSLLFTRTTKDDALDHPLRALIEQSALERPGVILADLVELSGRNYSTIRHHAFILEKLGIVRLVRRGRRVHLIPPPLGREATERAIILEGDPAVRQLFVAVQVQPLPVRDAVRAIQTQHGYSRYGATKVIQRAERAGLLQREDEVLRCET